jgi:hypothetical protein
MGDVDWGALIFGLVALALFVYLCAFGQPKNGTRAMRQAERDRASSSPKGQP